jgi:uncharacterized protein YfaS (alpha-2-macroglobulin family)
VYGQSLGADQTVTFAVGEAQPAIYAPGTPFVVLDPAASPRFSVFTVNFRRLDVKAYAVSPEDWNDFQLHLQSYYREENPTTPPGRLVLSTKVAIEYQPDKLVETAIDLSPALTDSKEPARPHRHARDHQDGPNPRIFRTASSLIATWVQATQIGLDAFVDNAEMVAWANSLADGQPLQAIQFDLLDKDGKPLGAGALSSEDGTARIALPAASSSILVGRSDDDLAMLPAQVSMWGEGGWAARSTRDSLRWHVFDDRGMHRPGEEVRVKGWIRRIEGAEDGDERPLRRGGLVSYRSLILREAR